MPFFLSVDQTIVDTIFLNTGAAVIAAGGVLVAATDGCILAARGVLLATADAAAIAAGRVLVAATDGRVVIAAGHVLATTTDPGVVPAGLVPHQIHFRYCDSTATRRLSRLVVSSFRQSCWFSYE